MNRSGEAVVRFMDYFQVKPDHLVVLHDDIDLPFGRVKVAAKGGAGGHNGIRSIIRHIGGTEFCRIKIGVGRPGVEGDGRGMPVDKYVLSCFAPVEQALLAKVCARIGDAVEIMVQKGLAACMNEINGMPLID